MPIKIVQTRPCNFRFSYAKGFEEIDFTKVAEIRHTLSEDPFDKIDVEIDRSLGKTLVRETVRKVVLVQVMGRKNAVCGSYECTAKRAFNFDDTDQIDRAKAAACFFRSNICKGRAF